MSNSHQTQTAQQIQTAHQTHTAPTGLSKAKEIPPTGISHTGTEREFPTTTCDSETLHTSASPTEPPKHCRRCYVSFPASYFRFRNRAKGIRMHYCRGCHAELDRLRRRRRREHETGWILQKTASQISRSTERHRTVALVEQLVDAMGGPQKLVTHWRAECLKLTKQRKRSTRLCRMYEMLLVLTCHVGR